MANPTDDLDPSLRAGLTALLIVIAGWGVVDLVLDAEAWASLHVVMEVTFVVLLLCAVAYLWSGGMRDRRGLRVAERRLEADRADRDEWKARANRLLTGLGAEIDRQFDRWGLTPAEREVGLLVLKGLGHKDAAQLLQRSERTVRQHAAAVYRKSGLAGRAELAAFFLEDLLLPPTPEPSPGPTQGPEQVSQEDAATPDPTLDPGPEAGAASSV